MIIVCCRDLIFATKIRSTAETLGVLTRPARDAAMLDARLRQINDGKSNEPVSAVIVGLDEDTSDIALIEQTKAHDPTITVIAFGSHVAAELLAAAKAAGADLVLPRSAFNVKLPELLKAYQGRT